MILKENISKEGVSGRRLVIPKGKSQNQIKENFIWIVIESLPFSFSCLFLFLYYFNMIKRTKA